ncbi:hypothetical protein ROV45_02000 [Pasteurella multocida]|uniref:hypothetical protein n=1 Tax=Pasteurella multocida TaxID=747 RepID=UPI002CC439FC|nr:hypothetical protein [Pasteurella multocida]MEB3489915.1 hypothetical protein [Pasteurella multocida]
MNIINLTQHAQTAEQAKSAKFVIITAEKTADIRALITFDEAPTLAEMQERARKLAQIATEHDVEYAMVGGAPFFASTLEKALLNAGITPVYAFSQREVVENTSIDGAVTKTAIFKHAGWIRAV